MAATKTTYHHHSWMAWSGHVILCLSSSLTVLFFFFFCFDVVTPWRVWSGVNRSAQQAGKLETGIGQDKTEDWTNLYNYVKNRWLHVCAYVCARMCVAAGPATVTVSISQTFVDDLWCLESTTLEC